MTKQDLIDLAIEYGLIRSTTQFNGYNAVQQAAILKLIRKLAGN